MTDGSRSASIQAQDPAAQDSVSLVGGPRPRRYMTECVGQKRGEEGRGRGNGPAPAILHDPLPDLHSWPPIRPLSLINSAIFILFCFFLLRYKWGRDKSRNSNPVHLSQGPVFPDLGVRRPVVYRYIRRGNLKNLDGVGKEKEEEEEKEEERGDSG